MSVHWTLLPTKNSTLVTATLSVALAVIVTLLPLGTIPPVGEVMEVMGAVVSAAPVTV